MCHSWDPLSKPRGLHVRYFPSCGAGVSSPERPGGVSDVHKVTQLVFKPWFADGRILTVPFRHNTANMSLDQSASLRRYLPP